MMRAAWVLFGVMVMMTAAPSSGMRPLGPAGTGEKWSLPLTGHFSRILRAMGSSPTLVEDPGDQRPGTEPPKPGNSSSPGKTAPAPTVTASGEMFPPPLSTDSASSGIPSTELRNAQKPKKPKQSANLILTFLKAAALGDTNRIEILLKSLKIDTEVRNAMGWTALNAAAASGALDVVRLLVESGANIEGQEERGQTPLGSASYNGHTAVVRYLLQQNPPADVSASDVDGAQPIHYATQFGFTGIVKILLDNGANIEAVTYAERWTPLHVAAAAGELDTARLLLEMGANPLREDVSGRRPFDIIGEINEVSMTKRRVRALRCLLGPVPCPGSKDAAPSGDSDFKRRG